MTGKTLFVSVGSDGMEIDSEGNVYLTTDDVVVYNSAGTKIDTINVLDRPTNLCFAGADRRTLFITTEKGFYSIPLRVQGATAAGSGTDTPPTITGTTRTPTVPSATDAVWVTSTVTDDSAWPSVKLTYVTGSGTGTTTTPFTETMGTTAVKPWTGTTGSTNAWTVTGNYFELRTGANYVHQHHGLWPGVQGRHHAQRPDRRHGGHHQRHQCRGHVRVRGVLGPDAHAWTGPMAGPSRSLRTAARLTRLSELTGSSHAFQKYHYDLASSELVSTLKLRFQFTGGGTGDDDRIDLDQITVTVTTGSVPVTVTMYDDGATATARRATTSTAARSRPWPAAPRCSYYVTATDDAGQTATDPATAPTDRYSYIVGHTTPLLQLNEILADSTTFLPTTDYPEKTVGLILEREQRLGGLHAAGPEAQHQHVPDQQRGPRGPLLDQRLVPGQSAYLLPNGHLLGACMTKGPLSTGGGEGGRDRGVRLGRQPGVGVRLLHRHVHAAPRLQALAQRQHHHAGRGEEDLRRGARRRVQSRAAGFPDRHQGLHAARQRRRDPAGRGFRRQRRLEVERLGPPDPGLRRHQGQLRRAGRSTRNSSTPTGTPRPARSCSSGTT